MQYELEKPILYQIYTGVYYKKKIFTVVTKTSEYIFTSVQVAIFFDKFNTV